MNTKENKIIRVEDRKSLKYWEDLLLEGECVYELAGLLATAALWNIRKHKLYEQNGHRNITSYMKAKGYSEHSVNKVRQKGDHIASTVALDEAGDPEFFLEPKHVEKYFKEVKRKRFENREQRKLLASHIDELSEIEPDIEHLYTETRLQQEARKKNPKPIKNKISNFLEMVLKISIAPSGVSP